jgi:hypothetical protein
MVSLLAVVLATACVAASAQDIDLSGEWFLQALYVEDYSISRASSAGHFDVTCGPGRCTAWKTANITVQQEANDTINALVSFDSGVQHSGVVVLAGFAIVWSDGSEWARVQPNRPVMVHVCPQAHIDPGWFQTVDQLFDSLFQYVISNVTTALAANQERTFAAEIAVIWGMFWAEANTTTQSLIRELVSNGQLEFTGA